VNFLPFLVHLSQQCGWKFKPVLAADAMEARGINTREDLRFFQERFATCSRGYLPAGCGGTGPIIRGAP
jgi:hypothetical protein